jgi:hypothetical protein
VVAELRVLHEAVAAQPWAKREKRKQNEPFGGDSNAQLPIHPHLRRVPFGLPC